MTRHLQSSKNSDMAPMILFMSTVTRLLSLPVVFFAFFSAVPGEPLPESGAELDMVLPLLLDERDVALAVLAGRVASSLPEVTSAFSTSSAASRTDADSGVTVTLVIALVSPACSSVSALTRMRSE